MQIGIQLTNLLEKFHSLGYVYNDLKPDNICIGNFTAQGQVSEQHKLFLIDFGLATEYLKVGKNDDILSSHNREHVKNGTSLF